MAYDVRTRIFEGPFDLLLHLILRQEVELYELDLAAIVDAYLSEVERMERLDLEVATEFALIAATLIELKSRRLLPGDDELSLDDELALWEERDLLLARLVDAKTFKEASLALHALSVEAARSVGRTAGPDERFAAVVPDCLAGVGPEELRAAFVRAATPRPVPRVELDHVAPIRASVADAVVELLDELPRVGRISFGRLTDGLVERLEIVVRFLALLELFKQGLVELDQPSNFASIGIRWVGDGPAGYPVSALVDTYDG